VVALSCELEGHPLGGGMLKLEPREAARIVLPPVEDPPRRADADLAVEAAAALRRWRHHEGAA
jgi:adenine-specific DNA-methyltransferase